MDTKKVAKQMVEKFGVLNAIKQAKVYLTSNLHQLSDKEKATYLMNWANVLRHIEERTW